MARKRRNNKARYDQEKPFDYVVNDVHINRTPTPPPRTEKKKKELIIEEDEIDWRTTAISMFFAFGAAAIISFSFLNVEPEPDINSGTYQDVHGSNSSTCRKFLPIPDPSLGAHRVIFVVIDAWRLNFLTDPKSPMEFIRSQLMNGKAVGFDAHARMPTVTLPRITAYLSGTLPSFGTIVMNFASEAMKIDNWVSAAKREGKKIFFFGDDTWLRLFPNTFDKSRGVTSFFVKDYTEVDNNVTEEIPAVIGGTDWDILILHYLGLDHIGHSLGGQSEMINVKLKEMDGIVEKLYQTRKGTNTLLIVVGDHGMTDAGSHGGASKQETRVPVVMMKTKDNVRDDLLETDHIPYFPRIEQLDVAATIASFMGLGQPKKSYGISLVRHLNKKWNLDQDFVKRDYMAMWRQFENLNTHRFSNDVRFINECENINVSSKQFQQFFFSKCTSVQEEQLQKAVSMTVEILLVAVGILCIPFFISVTHLKRFTSSLILLVVPLLSYVSSSYVEEEHEIWYFFTTTVFVLNLFAFLENWWDFRGHYLPDEYSIKLFLTAVISRICVGWRMSQRRRYSMDPALLPQSLLPQIELGTHFAGFVDLIQRKIEESSLGCVNVLWFFVIGKCDGLKNCGRWVNGPVLLSLLYHIVVMFNIKTKVAFDLTIAELLPYAIRICALVLVKFKPSLAILCMCIFIAPAQDNVVLALSFLLGTTTASLMLTRAETIIVFMSTFYFLGNSNSLATIDLAPAYTGLKEYRFGMVALQLFINVFSAPICFLVAHHNTVPQRTMDLVRFFFAFRVLVLGYSICVFIGFKDHLFAWTVFAPKVVYDIMHMLFSMLVLLFSFIFVELPAARAAQAALRRKLRAERK